VGVMVTLSDKKVVSVLCVFVLHDNNINVGNNCCNLTVVFKVKLIGLAKFNLDDKSKLIISKKALHFTNTPFTGCSF
jgi:adenylosuccinate synthase